MKCQYCNQPVTDPNAGALCPFHLDLEVLADYLRDRDKPVTLPALIALIEVGTKRGGAFEIVASDLPNLITPDFAEKYQMVEGVEV